MRLRRLCAAATLALCLPACALCEATEIDITVPDAYAQNGTLPVYALSRRDFADVVRPEWFDESGVVGKENLSKRGRYDYYTFADEDELSVSGEKDGTVYYVAKEGAAQVAYDDGSTALYPANERAANAHNLAMDVYWGYMDDPLGGVPASEALAHVSLAEARSQVEELLDRLGVTGYECAWAYGANRETIRLLNEQRNARIASGRLSTDSIYDFSELSEWDEGYALVYRARVDGVEVWASFMELRAFVSGEGVRVFSLSAPYAIGDVVATPDALLSPQEAAAFLPESARRSRISGVEKRMGEVTSASLIYALDPQAREARLRLLPAWALRFPVAGWPEEAVAYVSAVDGEVLDAPWK